MEGGSVFIYVMSELAAALEKRVVLGETMRMVELMTSLRSLRLNLKETSIIQRRNHVTWNSGK